MSASFASGEECFVTRQVRLEDRRLTPVPSGLVLSEAAGASGHPAGVELKLNSLSRFGFAGDVIWAGLDGATTTFDRGKASAFLLPLVLVHPSARRRVRSGDRAQVASTGGSPPR